MRITNTKDNDTNFLKILVYGDSGVGKTSLAKTIKEPTLIISSEAGLLCLKDASIDVVDISQGDDGKMIPKEGRIERLGQVYRFLQTDECKKYLWLVLDSLTEISQNAVEMLQAKYPGSGDALKLYGENYKIMRGLIKNFRDLPGVNVVFTALPATIQDENSRRFTSISMVGKMSHAIPAFFDEVFYMGIGKDKEGQTIRYLQTEKTDSITAKDRSGKLEKYEVADLDLIYNKIFKQ